MLFEKHKLLMFLKIICLKKKSIDNLYIKNDTSLCTLNNDKHYT